MAVDNNTVEDTFVADGSGSIIYEGFGLTLFFDDDFDGGNIIIETSADGTNYQSEVTAQTVPFNWSVGVEVPKGMEIKWTLAGTAGSPPNVIVTSFKGGR